MKKKRPTPKRLPSGTWRCQVMVNGQRVSVTDENPVICQSKAMAIQAGIMEQEEQHKKKLTLSQAIDEYIESKSETLSPSTIRGYRQVQAIRFPGIMQADIRTLKKPDIQRAVNQESKSVSAKTVANAYGLVRAVLKVNDIDVFGVKLPQWVKPKKKYLQPEEIARLIEVVQGDTCEIQILLAVWLGLRRSEICGLCWDCVDLQNSTITVRRALIPDENHKWVLREGAKNITSQRTISCPEYIRDKLESIQNGRTSGRCFSEHPDTVRKHIHAACKKAGITDTGIHGLRHTNAAVMRYLGISDAHAMERGGWSEESTYKKIYSYVFDGKATTEDELINGFFTPQRGD